VSEGARPPGPDWLSNTASYAWRMLVVAGVALLCWLFFQQLKLIVIGMVVGYLETVALWPIVRWLQARRLPKALAAVIAVAVAMFFLGAVFLLIIDSLVTEAGAIAAGTSAGGDQIKGWLEDIGAIGPETARQIFSSISDLLKEVAALLGSSIVGAAAFLGQLVTLFFLAQFLTVYLLSGWPTIWEWILGLRPAGRRAAWDEAGRAGSRTVAAWLRAQTMIALFDAVSIGLGIALLGVPLVKPIMVLTFLLGYIPLVGALLSGAVAVLVALGAEGFPTALGVLAIVIIVQQLEGNVLGPLLTARAVRFHPVATFLMMSIAGALFGISGMVLAVPVSGAIVAMTAVLRSTAWRRAPPAREIDPLKGSGHERLPA
jgi:putative heme transporter